VIFEFSLRLMKGIFSSKSVLFQILFSGKHICLNQKINCASQRFFVFFPLSYLILSISEGNKIICILTVILTYFHIIFGFSVKMILNLSLNYLKFSILTFLSKIVRCKSPVGGPFSRTTKRDLVAGVIISFMFPISAVFNFYS
jgi:hypothetical protein